MSDRVRPMFARAWSPAARRPVLLLAVLVGVLMIRLDVGILTEAGARKDALNNLDLAHGLATTGRLVESGDEPSMYREPLPIALYALQMRVDPRLEGVVVADLEGGGPEVRALRQQNLLWGALLLAGVALQAWRLASDRSRLLAAAASVVLVHAMFLEVVGDFTLTELHGATAVVWAGLVAQQWVLRRRPRDAVLLGVLLGLGALTKSSLLYVGGVFVLVLVGLVLVRDRRAVRRTVATAALALIALTVVVLPWMARNAAEFDTWSIADRGGLSLWYRAMYQEATPAELRGSWYEFTPLPLRPVAGALLGIEPEDLDGPLRRVNRYHPDEDTEQLSFYELARVDRFEGTEDYLAVGVPTRALARVMADQDLLRRGIEVLRDDPWLFASTTPMFLWRGMWVVKAAPLIPRVVLSLFNPLGMAALLAAGATAVLGARPGRFAVIGLPLGVVAFSALLTMYEPRFTELALPTMLVLLVTAASRLLERRWPGMPRGAGAP